MKKKILSILYVILLGKNFIYNGVGDVIYEIK